MGLTRKIKKFLSFDADVRRLLSFDPEVRMILLNRITGKLMPGYRMTWHQLEWFHDAEFNEALDRFDGPGSLNGHRRWNLGQLNRLTAGVKGDTAECGVLRGASSWEICRANKMIAPGRIHHLFDSFEGLSEPDAVDGDYWKKGDLSVSEADVLRSLDKFRGNIVSHRGWIPDRFEDVAETRFSFVHVDVDLYQPTFDSIAFFYDLLEPGGILVCDDYGFSSCPGATRAVDEFLADKPESMINLASGGGFFIRGTAAF